MKKNIYLILAIASVIVTQSCNNTDRNGRDDEATILADSVSDTTTRANALTADVDLNGDDKIFILTAANNGIMEVEAANIILKKSKNADVKAIAQQIIADHTKANKDLEAIVKGKGIDLPTVLGNEQAKHISNLNGLSDRALDVNYITTLIDNHNKMIALFTQGTRLNDVNLKTFSVNNLPLVTAHYQKAVKLGEKLNISNQGNGDDLNGMSPSDGNTN